MNKGKIIQTVLVFIWFIWIIALLVITAIFMYLDYTSTVSMFYRKILFGSILGLLVYSIVARLIYDYIDVLNMRDVFSNLFLGKTKDPNNE